MRLLGVLVVVGMMSGCAGSAGFERPTSIDPIAAEATMGSTQVCFLNVCVPVKIAVGWADGRGKVCLVEPARICLPVGP